LDGCRKRRRAETAFALAILANRCDSATYLADIPLEFSGLQRAWRRWRRSVFLAGTLFAVLQANDWIADEMHP
jgi:hypothetical protein